MSKFTEKHETICPYCGYSSSKEPHELPWGEGDSINETCGSCKKKFTVRPVIKWMGWESEEIEE